MVIFGRKTVLNSAKLADELTKYKSATVQNNLAQRLSFYCCLPDGGHENIE